MKRNLIVGLLIILLIIVGYLVFLHRNDFRIQIGEYKSKCTNNGDETVSICLVHNHEDSSIIVNLDFTNLNDIEKYSSLGFMISGPGYNNNNGDSVKSLEKKVYSRVVANLEPNSEYEICLSGLNKDYTTTGYFGCVNVKTEPMKSPVAIIMKNYDIDSATIRLISQWLSEVKMKNPSLTIKEITLNKGKTSDELLQILRTEYESSNLKYVVLIGFDLPIPQISSWDETIYSIKPYTSLSKSNHQFLYDDNSFNEVSVAVIRPEQKEKINNYLERLIRFYKGSKNYDHKVLIANAMIPSEAGSFKADFVNSRYSNSSIDYLGGITDYGNSNQAKQWKQDFLNYLAKNNYEFLILNAHGARDNHNPCDDNGCVTSNFIKNTNLNVQFIIGISCNIGNFMTVGSPMVSYIFDGNSLVGLGAEVPYVDFNSQTAKDIFSKIVKDSENIADASRPYGFVIIGDPFLKLTE